MALAAVGKRQKPFSRSSPMKSRSGIFPRRPSGSKSGTKTTEVPLFVPDEDDDHIPQVVYESEDGEWEDFDEELEGDQMSIAIAESLELQHQSRGTSDTRAPTQTPILRTPVELSRRAEMDEDEGEFESPSRLATQLTIAGARKPLSTRISFDSMRGTAAFSLDTPSTSLKKLTPSLTPNQVLDLPPGSLGRSDIGDKGESDEDDDMEEVAIPLALRNSPLTPPEPLISPDPLTAADPADTSLAIEVEHVVAKGFAEFQKIFAEKRNRFRAENLEFSEEMRQTREVSRAYSPGIDYANEEVGVIEVEEKGREAMEVRSSPPPHSDEDMEEVVVVVAPPSVPPRAPQPLVNSEHPESSTPVVRKNILPEYVDEKPDEGNEDAPISDWSRSPSPQPYPPAGEAGPSTSVLTLDHSRGLLDPDESFEQVPPGEQDQEHEDFDAAHEMDPDAEAGEFARWMSQVKGRNLDDVRKEIDQEINVLRKEKKAAMRDSEDITGQMVAQIMVSLVGHHTTAAHHSEIGFHLGS